MPPTEAPPAPPPAAEPKPSAPPPIPSGEKPPQDYLGDITSELADMDAGAPPPPPPSPPPRDDKGKFKPAPKPAAEKPVEKAPEKAPQQPETPPEVVHEPPKPVRAAELRTAYEGLKKKVAEDLQPTIQRLEAKIKEYETKKPEETEPILQKLKTLEEQNADLERRMALVDYEQSGEFATKYEQPYRQMWERATNAFNQLTVKESAGTDELGEAKFNVRRATEADLIKLGALPLSELDEAAQTMFGASAPRAIQYIERLRELAEAKQTALVEAKQKAGEWKSQRTLEEQNNQRARAVAWKEINDGLQEKFPKAYNPDEGNADDAAAHTHGFALANLKFLGPKALSPEMVEALPPGIRDTIKAGKTLSQVQIVQMDALVRLKAANHDRLIAGRKADKARIAELEKALAEYEKSEPGTEKAGASPRAVSKDWEQEVADELKALDR